IGAAIGRNWRRRNALDLVAADEHIGRRGQRRALAVEHAHVLEQHRRRLRLLLSRCRNPRQKHRQSGEPKDNYQYDSHRNAMYLHDAAIIRAGRHGSSWTEVQWTISREPADRPGRYGGMTVP